MAEKKTTKKSGGKLKFAAALVGIAATGHYLYGKHGKENREKIKAWTVKAKGDVLEQFEKRKEITEEQYKAIIDKTTAKYAKLKTVSAAEVKKLNKELKSHWKEIQASAECDAKKKK